MPSGIVVEAQDGRLQLHPGDAALLRVGVMATNGHDVPVDLRLLAPPAGWQTKLSARHVDVRPGTPSVVSIAVAVPQDCPAGAQEILVEASHPEGRSLVAFPVDVHARRRWGRIGVVAGAVAAGAGAAVATFWWWRHRE